MTAAESEHLFKSQVLRFQFCSLPMYLGKQRKQPSHTVLLPKAVLDGVPGSCVFPVCFYFSHLENGPSEWKTCLSVRLPLSLWHTVFWKINIFKTRETLRSRSLRRDRQEAHPRAQVLILVKDVEAMGLTSCYPRASFWQPGAAHTWASIRVSWRRALKQTLLSSTPSSLSQLRLFTL